MVSNGAVPYLDIWDVKPPLVLETTAVVALIARDDMMNLHRLCSFITVLAALSSLLLVGIAVTEITGECISSSVVCLCILAYGPFVFLGWLGFSPKLFSLLFGLLALRLSQKEYFFLGGIAAGASSLFYQFGAVFLGVILIQEYQNRRNSGLLALGALGTFSVSLMPILTKGAIKPMVHQTVLSHLLIRESISLGERLTKILGFMSGVSISLLVLGIIGLLVASLRDPKWRTFFFLSCIFSIQVLFLDLDGGADLVFLLFFSATGLGWLTSKLPVKIRAVLLPTFSLLVTFTLVGHRQEISNWMLPTGNEPSLENRAGLPGMTYILLNRYIPPSCHYRLSSLEREWIERQGGFVGSEQCYSTWQTRRQDPSGP